MAKFFSRLFSRGSSLHGSRSSLTDNQNRNKTSSSVRTSASLENLASYHVIPKELEKNKLHKASWEGNLNKVIRLARPGQINLKDQQMRTPLHLAVVKGHIEIVRHLVQEDAKLNVIDNEQRTPLIKAVLSGNQNPQLNYQICQVLIDGGAGDYINAVDKHGRNALHYAIDFGNQHLVELFLSNENCDPNYRDRDQMTPLHLAIKRNSPQIVQLLLSDQRDQQADPNIANRYGQTPLHIAASVGYIDIVRLLLLSNLREPCDPTILDSQQLTAYALAKANHQESCAKLIEEYQEKRYRPELRRQTTTSMNDQSIKATNSISLIPAANLQRDRDETSDESSSISTTKPSKSSPRRIKRPSDEWSDENGHSMSESKQISHGINNLFKHNPIQPDEIKRNSALNTLFNNNPLQRNSKKKTSTSQQTKSSSFAGIGPVIERIDSDNTSTSMSIPKSGNQAQPTSKNKPVNTVHQPISNAKSWSDDTITAPPKKKQEPKSNNSWDTSASDDDLSASKQKPISSNLQKTKPLSPSTNNLTSSDSDDNSVETKIRKLDIQKPSNEIIVENLVNKQITNNYKVIGLSSEDSSWTTSPVPIDKELPTKGIHSLVQQKKTDESTWDDSRPLSADLKSSKKSKDLSKKETPGVENLIKIMDTIIHSNKKSTSPKVIGRLIVSSLGDRTDSMLSENTLHEVDNDEEYEQSMKKKTQEWSVIGTNEHDFKNLHRSISPANDVRINDLKENIKKLERNQEDARELKRQLRDMENKKNAFEKLYQENDQNLRDVETKLEQEKSEKQRLEWTTKNLNNELKNIKQKLQSLEEEKDLLNDRCIQLQEERNNHDEKLRTLQASSLHSPSSSFRDDDVNRMNSRHREDMKLLSTENDELHHRKKKLQSDLELHKESLDVTLRCKIDLEKAIEEKIAFQQELDRLKYEKDLIKQEKLEYKTKYDTLQEEIRLILFDRSKLEQKLTSELQEHFQEKQQSTDDLQKYRTEIEQLNVKLNDAESRLLILQTKNESLLTLKDHDIKNESYKSKTEPLVVLTSPSLNNRSEYQYLNKTYPQQQQHNENYLIENSRQIRSDTERVKSELDRLRENFDKLVSNYEPINNFHHQTQLHSQIDTFRQFYQQEFRQRQLFMSKLTNGTSTYSNNHLVKQRLETAIDSNLAEHRLQIMAQLPRQASALLTVNTTNNGVMSSVELLRKHYRV